MRQTRPGTQSAHVHHPHNSHTASQGLAELIARGEIPFPADLTTTEVLRLAAEVRQLRQQQFLTFIAELIARDILRAKDNGRGT